MKISKIYLITKIGIKRAKLHDHMIKEDAEHAGLLALHLLLKVWLLSMESKNNSQSIPFNNLLTVTKKI